MRSFEEVRQMPLVLASRSPRRREMFEAAGFNFRVNAVDTDETVSPELALADIPIQIAVEKARAVAQVETADARIVAADTIVAAGENGDHEIMGKPRDAADAAGMLSRLSDSVHQVITGVCIARGDQMATFQATTQVEFAELTDEEIAFYVGQYKPFDKAGAYAIQEWIGQMRIRAINGCYYNVVGLPLSRLYEQLTQLAWL